MFYSDISFDWYEATVFFGSVSDFDVQVFDGTVDAFIADMLDDLNHVYSVKSVIARNGWLNSVVLVAGSHEFCRVSWNHSSSSKHCLSVCFTGSDATKGANWLRNNFPEHSLTRCDLAADTCFDSSVQPVPAESMFLDVIEIAKEFGLSTSVVGDWFGDKGRTLYIGSTKSAYRMRIYEKGKQDDNASIGGINWVRFELVCRPDKKRRADAALLSPAELMGSWKFAVRVLGIYYKPIDNTESLNKIVRQSPEMTSSLLFMCKQYKNHLTQLNKTCLNLHEFGDKIMQMVVSLSDERAPEIVSHPYLPPLDAYSDLF